MRQILYCCWWWVCVVLSGPIQLQANQVIKRGYGTCCIPVVCWVLSWPQPTQTTRWTIDRIVFDMNQLETAERLIWAGHQWLCSTVLHCHFHVYVGFRCTYQNRKLQVWYVQFRRELSFHQQPQWQVVRFCVACLLFGQISTLSTCTSVFVSHPRTSGTPEITDCYDLGIDVLHTLKRLFSVVRNAATLHEWQVVTGAKSCRKLLIRVTHSIFRVLRDAGMFLSVTIGHFWKIITSVTIWFSLSHYTSWEQFFTYHKNSRSHEISYDHEKPDANEQNPFGDGVSRFAVPTHVHVHHT